MKSLFTIKSGGAASWAMRLAVAAVLAALMLWVPTRGSDSLIEVCTTAFTLMAAALSLNLLLGEAMYPEFIQGAATPVFYLGTKANAVVTTTLPAQLTARSNSAGGTAPVTCKRWLNTRCGTPPA